MFQTNLRLVPFARLIQMLVLAVAVGVAMPAAAQTDGGVKMEWLTWSFFRITSPTGKIILFNPWLNNPDSKTKLEDIDKADIILVPTAHPDETGQTVEIAKKTGATVIATFEMTRGPFKGKIPPSQMSFVVPGHVVEKDGITIRAVGAVHGSGSLDGQYGGAALGFFITFENGYKLYFSGSTDVTSDMQLWGRLFKPDAAILYYNSKMNPPDVAEMARLLSLDNPNLKTVIPHHHRVNSTPEKSPQRLAQEMKRLGVSAELLDPKPGEVYTLSR